MRRKSLGKGLRALIPTKADKLKEEEEQAEREKQAYKDAPLDADISPDQIAPEKVQEEALEDQSETPIPVPVPTPVPVEMTSEGEPEDLTMTESPEKDESAQSDQMREDEPGRLLKPDDKSQIMDEFPEEILQQLKEIKELDFDSRRITTYQKALERAWFDEKITADEQFILDGLREVLEISNEEHKIVESEILRELEKRYSEGIEDGEPKGKIESEQERLKREIYQYFQRGSELYEADKYFEAIMEWEKILELEPANPIIMKAINNARRQLESPALEELGKEPVYSYTNPVKEEMMRVEMEKLSIEEQHEMSKTAWLKAQYDIQSQLKTIKTEDTPDIELKKKKISKLFKAGYKSYKAGKYARAIKLWRRVLKLHPKHKKARKGVKLAIKKYKLMKKEKLKKKEIMEKKVKPPVAEVGKEITEMEIPEVAEAEAAAKVKALKEAVTAEMEMPEIAEVEPLEPEIVAESGELGAEPSIPVEEEAVTSEPAEEPAAESITEPELPFEEPSAEEAPSIEGDLEAAAEIKRDLAKLKEAVTVDLNSILETEQEPEAIEEELPAEAEAETPIEEPSEPSLEIEDTATEVGEFAPPEPEVESFAEPEAELEIPVLETTPEPETIPRSPEEIERDYYEEAVNRVRYGRFFEAIDILDEVIKLNPLNSDAWNDKGILFWGLNRHEDALECYEKAIELQPELSDAFLNKGEVLQDLNRPEEALLAFDRLLELNPQSEEGWTSKGNLLFQMANWNDAIESLSKSAEYNPNNVDILLKLGTSYKNLEQFSNASKIFQRILEINPGDQRAIEGIDGCKKNLKWELLKAWNI